MTDSRRLAARREMGRFYQGLRQSRAGGRPPAIPAAAVPKADNDADDRGGARDNDADDLPNYGCGGVVK